MKRLPEGLRRATLLLALCLALTIGCAAKRTDLIMVVPDADGRVGQVSVQANAEPVLLDTANEAVTVDDRGRVKPAALSEEEVTRVFGQARSATPLPSRRFTLYFEEGTEELVPSSASLLPEILEEIRLRPVCELEVIGHTDRLDNDEYNDRLSYARAGAVRAWLVENGVHEGAILATGRGERDPIVPTEDGVAEPRNRRVEVTVR